MLCGPKARGQEPGAPEAIAVEFSDCEPERFSADSIVGAVRRELEGVTVLQPAPAAGVNEYTRVELHLAVDCSLDAQRIHAAVVNPRSGARVERDLSLADVPVEDRPRVVALASGELLQTLGYQLHASSTESAPTAAFPPAADAPRTASETVTSAKPPARTRPPAPRPPATGNAPPRDSRQTDDALAGARQTRTIEWLVGGKLRWFPEQGGLLVGGGGGVRLERFALGLEALTGSSEDPLGEAWVGTSALTAGYELARVTHGALALRGAIAGALGLTWAFAERSAPNVDSFSTVQLYLDARATLVLEWGPAEATRLLLGLELGRAAGLIATADDQPIAATGGWFAGTTLGGRF